MPVILTDTDNVSTIHIAERLEINLLEAQEDVRKMEIVVYFNVDTTLPNGKKIGQTYWDNQNILRINCKENPELENAMRVIQETIGIERYKQLTQPNSGGSTE